MDEPQIPPTDNLNQESRTEPQTSPAQESIQTPPVQQPQSAPPQLQLQPQGSNSKIGIWVLVIVVIIAALVIGYLLYQNFLKDEVNIDINIQDGNSNGSRTLESGGTTIQDTGGSGGSRTIDTGDSVIEDDSGERTIDLPGGVQINDTPDGRTIEY